MIDCVRGRRKIQERKSSNLARVFCWSNVDLYADWRLFRVSELCMWNFFWSIWEQNLIKIQVKNYNMTISKASGNFPSASERFTIFVIDQARILALSFKIWVGHDIGHMIFWVIAE